MQEYIPELLIVASFHILAVISPGPDFALILKNSLVTDKRNAILSAFGIALGIIVHTSFAILGISWIISQSKTIYSIIQYLGASYLIFIGLKALCSKKAGSTPQDLPTEGLTNHNPILTGFLTNVLNPKATLFFLSLFTQVISLKTPIFMKVIYSTEMFVATFLWFSFVATMISHPRIKQVFQSQIHRIEKVFGVILISLGLKVALSSNK